MHHERGGLTITSRGGAATRGGKAHEPEGGHRANGCGGGSNQPNHHVRVAAVAMPSTAHSALCPPGSSVMSNQARSLTTNNPRPATTRSVPITRCQVGRKGPRALALGVYRPLGAGCAAGAVVVVLDLRCGLRGVEIGRAHA